MMTKVRSLHGTTPAEIFESGLENIDDIQAVALSVLWSDGALTAGWPNVDVSTLARMVLLLDEAQRRCTIPQEDS
jgi:hypothetical protein